MPDKIDLLFDDLQSRGFAKDKSREDFRSYMLAPGQQGYENRKTFFEDFKSQGLTDLGSYEEFRDLIGLHAKPKSGGGGKPAGEAAGTVAEPAGKPQDTGMSGFEETIRNARQAVGQSQQAVNRIQNRQQRIGLDVAGLNGSDGQYGRVDLGKNRKVTKGKQRFNLGTGQMESTYITEEGNEYGSREGADIEQNAVDIAKRQMTLPGQLDDAYAERERLQAEIDAETQRIGYGQSPERSFAPQVPGSIPRQSAERLSNDRLQTLYAAQRQNEERITALEAERDDDGGTQFWRGFIDAAKNPSTWTFGITDFQNMTQLMRIKGKVDGGKELTDDEETLLKNTMANGYAQQMFGENRGFMYRAGGISMQALPFVAEFVGTGGFSSLTQMGASAGEKVAEKLALEGLKKTLLRNTGVVMGDIASSFIMANTTGAARTGADIMERNIGQVTMDEEGNYQFEGGKGIGQSIYEGEVASTLEYYTEKLGEHLQLGNWIAKGADKMGLSKLSKAVGYLSNSKMLNAGGIQDYPSEVVEEQANLLLNAILVGDNNFSIDPNSKDFDKSVFNPKTQLDIWGGMLFSIGLMQAPRLAHTGYSAAGYYAYKHGLDVADTKASAVFGADNWQMIKEEIDNSDNDNISELLASVVNGDMSSEQKEATMFYADNLLKMRGYNNGMMADVRGEAATESQQSEPDAEAFLSQGIDQGYQQGHEVQEPDEKKVIVDEANAAEQELSHIFSDQDMQWITNTEPMEAINVMLSNRGTNPGEWNDDEIAAVVDYYQKQARAQGVMDAAADDVEYQVAKANAEVDANTHKDLNQIIMAESGGEQFYIVGGDVRLTPAADAPGTVAFDMEGTGDALIVRNRETGEISVKSPQMLSVMSVEDPNALIQENETFWRNKYIRQHENDITFGSPAQEVFQLEDTVTLNDGQGNVIEGEIGMMPNSIDGVYVVYTTDGKAMQFTGDELNLMIVSHNGQPVQRASTMSPESDQVSDQVMEGQINGQVNQPETQAESVQQPESQQNGKVEETEQQQSALDRIPVLQDESGKPILNRKGKKQYQWHKASVEDAAAALVETTGGDMLMARDTASDLVNQGKQRLEKIRKQKPKGDDPIEIAESRMEIKRQEQEQQDIIKQWQDVNQQIQKQMNERAATLLQQREQAKSEEQRRKEAEEARILKEQQDEQDRKRIREQIEKDREKRNKEYEPLTKAKEEVAGDAEARAILDDVEPRDLEEFVSSQLRPHSILWQDASEAEIGLQSELGLKRGDMQRFMTLIGTKESNAKPFGKVVLDIYEGLTPAMKEQYTDEDVRNTLLDMFRNYENSRQMMNVAAENRIAEARQMVKEHERMDQEAELEAWAEAYHLNPEERETFEAYLQEPPTEIEQEIINQIIADNEQKRTSPSMGEQSVGGRPGGSVEGREGEVRREAETADNGDYAQGTDQGTEAAAGEPAAAGDEVAGGAQVTEAAADAAGTVVDREAIRTLFGQLGVNAGLADLMSDYEAEQLNAMIEWADSTQEQDDFEEVHQYVEGLQTKYGAGVDGETIDHYEGAIPTPKIDNPRYEAIRQALIDAYESGDPAAITAAATAIQQYVDEGLDSYGVYSEAIDDYEGDDPTMLADQYLIHVFQDRYLDDDEDQEYIKTGIKSRDFVKNTLATINEDDGIVDKMTDAEVARLRELINKWNSFDEKQIDEVNAAYFEVKRAIDELTKKYKTKIAIENAVTKHLAKYRTLAPVEVISIESDEDLLSFTSADELEEVRQYLKDSKLPAAYDPITNKIRIFAENLNEEDVEEVLFHENIHSGLQQYYGDGVREIAEAFWETESPTNPEGTRLRKNAVSKAYAKHPEEIKEEYLAHALGRQMTTGTAGNIIARLSAEHQEIIDIILHNIGYDTAEETKQRKPETQQNDRVAGEVRPAEVRHPGGGVESQPIGKTSSAAEIAAEEAKVDTNPTEGQKEAGNYQKGHINVDGYDITIENPKGSVRSGVDSQGNRWETTMRNTYGYIRRTEGVDGDHIDVFLSDNPTSGSVFVVDQINPAGEAAGTFDEHKVMYGFVS